MPRNATLRCGLPFYVHQRVSNLQVGFSKFRIEISILMRSLAGTKIAPSDVRQLVEMSLVLRDMLDLIHQGFSTLDLECARKVLQMDKEIDRVCHAMFQKHLEETVAQGDTTGFDVLLMAQALERAGDHTTNLAEDLYNLIEGRSLRHAPKKRAAN